MDTFVVIRIERKEDMTAEEFDKKKFPGKKIVYVHDADEVVRVDDFRNTVILPHPDITNVRQFFKELRV